MFLFYVCNVRIHPAYAYVRLAPLISVKKQALQVRFMEDVLAADTVLWHVHIPSGYLTGMNLPGPDK